MKLHVIYRTKKGQLTFKMQEEVAYTIYARSKENAEEMLQRMKDWEKQQKKAEENNG